MNTTATEKWLLNEMEEIEVIDAHEHLPRESTRLAEPTDALTFFRQYTRLVMFSAGMDEATFMRMHDMGIPWERRLAIFDQYRDLIRFSGSARAAYIALKEFYGEDDLTRDNYESITTRMQELYKPGLYQKVLRDTCHIQVVLQNSDDAVYDNSLLRPVPMLGIGGEWNTFSDFAQQILRGEHEFNSPDEYLESRCERLRKLKEQGAVGFKHAAHLYCEPDRKQAEDVFKRLRQRDEYCARTNVPNPLLNYLTDRLLEESGKLEMPVAVHTGVWGDYREIDVKEMIPYIMRHPEVRFDLFHMGLPSVRDAGRIGANFGNVWLNICWAHTLSPTMAANALDEWLDQVAVNKIIAFGGDVRWPVEKVYGNLTLAKEVVATVLARRIDKGLLNREQAMYLVHRFFLKNPAELYKVR